MKRLILLQLLWLTSSLLLCAAEADSLSADTLHVDWYVTPVVADKANPLPAFGEMVKQPAAGAPSVVVDYSEAAAIEIEEPRFAWVNITGLTALPTVKSDVRKVWVEVHDGRGGFFRKRALLNVQGGWSLKFPKRNFACQFCDDEWKGETTPDIRIGDWVWQDEFHFKAFYTDFSRGVGEVGYKLFYQMVTDRPPYWERGGHDIPSKRARCFPDGFPCAVYLEGKFHGIYAWQLKKSRKNMNMEKTNELHIHLDGNLNNQTLFRGTVKWAQFDIRHPKDAYCTERTKEAIRQLSRYHAELSALEASGADSLAMAQAFEERFDIASLLDYALFHQFVCNCDGSLKNWQWFTYDGRKWFVTPYDLDQTFGVNLYGVVRPAVWHHPPLTEGPFYWVERYYQPELRRRYAQLRTNGVLTADNIQPLMQDWCQRVGGEMYAQERTRWPDSPCYGEVICNTGWQPSSAWAKYATTPDYSSAKTYRAGDLCKLEGRLWEATQTVAGVRPYQRNSQPDSLQRWTDWVADRLAFLDGQYRLSGLPQAVGPVPSSPPGDEPFYNLAGQRVASPRKGVYIRGGRKVLFR